MSSNSVRFRPWRLIFAALIALPPCLRVALRDTGNALPLPLPEAQALRAELETARNQLARTRAELETRGSFKLAERYEVETAQVLPLSDPSPSRSVLWAFVPDRQAVPRDVAVLWKAQPAPDGAAGDAQTQPAAMEALLGRVLRSYRAASIIRVQTLLDPEFRVRFRRQGASGILGGTGHTSQGAPVLEIRHLSELIELTEGEALVTEGNDGVFPEGILIGFVERERPADVTDGTTEAERERRFNVRCAVSPEGLSTIALAIDRAREGLTTILEREAREDRKP